MFDKTSQSNPPEADSTVMTDDREQQEAAEAAPSSADSAGDSENWPGKYQLLQDQFTRLAADFDNYRKRIREEQEQLAKYGAQKSAMELLPVLDNLERATASLTESSDPQVLFKSFGVVQKQLMDGLASLGIQKMQAIGQEFDPMFHEAVNRMASAEFPENTIMYEAQSGYLLHDKVIRPAMVVVSTGAAESDSAEAAAPAAKAAAETEEEQSNPFRR